MPLLHWVFGGEAQTGSPRISGTYLHRAATALNLQEPLVSGTWRDAALTTARTNEIRMAHITGAPGYLQGCLAFLPVYLRALAAPVVRTVAEVFLIMCCGAFPHSAVCLPQSQIIPSEGQRTEYKLQIA